MGDRGGGEDLPVYPRCALRTAESQIVLQHQEARARSRHLQGRPSRVGGRHLEAHTPAATQLQLRGGAALILSKDDSQKPVGELGGPPTSSGYDEAAPLDEGAGWRLIGTRRTSW